MEPAVIYPNHKVLPCNVQCHAWSSNWLTPSRFSYQCVGWRPKQRFDFHHCSGWYFNIQMTSSKFMVLLAHSLSHTKSNGFMDNTHLWIPLEDIFNVALQSHIYNLPGWEKGCSNLIFLGYLFIIIIIHHTSPHWLVLAQLLKMAACLQVLHCVHTTAICQCKVIHLQFHLILLGKLWGKLVPIITYMIISQASLFSIVWSLYYKNMLTVTLM